MADNIDVSTQADQIRTMRTTEAAGVHTPHYIIEKPVTYSGKAVAVGNALTKLRDGFDTYDTTNTWDEVKHSTDIIEIDGNANGSSYLKIVKDPRVANTISQITSKVITTMPLRSGFGCSVSQRQQACDANFEMVGCDPDTGTITSVATPADLTATSLSQSTTTLTINFATAHNLVPGDRISVIGCVDSRLNYSSLLVATIPTTTQITCTATTYAALPSVTASPAGGATIRRTDYGNYAVDVLGVLADSATSTSSILYRRRGIATEQKTAVTSLGANWLAATVPTAPVAFTTAGAYAFSPNNTLDMRLTLDLAQVGVLPSNTNTVGTFPAGYAITENIPDESKGYKIRVRFRNLEAFPVPVGKIALATKSGTTTATITTDVAHGLSVNDFVQIYGIRDITNFPNLTTATQVASIVSSTQFTIVIAGAVTATSWGGAVFRINGGNLSTALVQNIQSISATGGVLTVIGNTTWAGISIGEHVCLHGIYNTSGTGIPAYDAIFKVRNVATTTLTLVPAQIGQTIADVTSTNCGGAVIKCNDLRIHFLRVLDFTRLLTEAEPSVNRSNLSQAFPVMVNNTTLVTEGPRAHDATLSGAPFRIAGRAVTANYTAVATGDVADIVCSTVGALITKPHSIPEADFRYTNVITNNTATAVQAAGAAGIRNYVTGFQYQNTSATASEIQLQDGATAIWRGQAPANMATPAALQFDIPLRTTAATALNVQLIITGTNTFVNVQGYQAP